MLNIQKNLDIRPVRWIDEVLQVALSESPEKAVAGAADKPAKDTEKETRSEGKVKAGTCTHH